MAKKKDATETVSPQLPDEPNEGATGAQTPNPSQSNAADTEAELADVMAALKQYELDNPEKIENVVRASQQAGRSAQLLGEQRELVRQLQAELARLQQTRTSNEALYTNGEETPVDLKSLIRGELNEFYSGIQKKQTEMTQRQWEAFNEIQSDEDYPIVKNAWEEYIRQPSIVYSFQTGAVDPVKEYNKFVRKFQRKLLHRTKGLLEQVTSGSKKITPPFVEQGTNTPDIPTDPTELNEKIKTIKQKHKGVGSETGMEEILDALIPADDPLLRRR